MQQRSNGFNVDINESLGVIKQNFQSVNMVMENITKFQEIFTIKNLNKSSSVFNFILIFQNVNIDTFINPFNFSNRKLQLGQWIDVKDTIDQWVFFKFSFLKS